MKDIAFLLEIQKLALEMDNLVDKYDMRDRFVSILVSGFLQEDDYGELNMNAIYSYHLSTIFELTEILDFINNTFEHEFEYDPPENFENFDDDVDDFLESLGIDTE
mgnify:FL=1|jgi:hypothetical protein|tara:strand:- start:24 stop:341 length:318 start_codon:yes stop_codon:yes gene_type:complete